MYVAKKGYWRVTVWNQVAGCSIICYIIICYIQRRNRWVWTQNRRSITTANVMKNSTRDCNFSRFRWKITQATTSVIQDSPSILQYSKSSLYQTTRFSMPKIEITLGRC